jgi:hypothetical protein
MKKLKKLRKIFIRWFNDEFPDAEPKTQHDIWKDYAGTDSWYFGVSNKNKTPD